jgi:hypothetical protein
MTDPGILSDEQPNLVEDPRKLFKLEPDRMGPEDPMEADFRAAEAGDQQAAMRLQRQLQTLPPGIARSRAQQRLTKAIASGVGQFGEPAPMLKPWWYVSKEAAPVSLQTLEDQLGALTGGLLGEGVGESGELLATESQRKLMDQGYGTGLAFETGLMEILPAREKYTDALKGFLVGTYGGVDAAIKTYQAEQQKRKDNREKAIQDLRYSRDWIRNTLVPGVVNDLEAGVGINTIRARINASNVQANRRLGIEIDNERKRRHAAQKPADASEQEWMSRFRPYADAFVGAGDTLADMAAELPEIGVVEDLGQSLENITGMAGQVFKNLNLSDLQDDYQTAAQLVRDNKPVPKEISDRIVAYEIQKLRRRTEGAGIVHDFTQSAGYAVDQYLGGKVFGKAVEAGGKLLGQAARLAPKTLGNIARGLGVAGDDVLKASMESSGFFRKLGDGLAKARTEVTLMSRAKELGVETVGTKAVGVAREVGRGLGAAAGEMGAVSVATGATSLAREGDLSEMRVGRAGMNALERQMAEELQVGIDPDTGRPTFAASEQPVSDSVRFSDIVDTADEYISERIGQFLPVVGRSPASKAAKRGQFLNLLRGSVAGRGVAEKLRKAAAGAADAVPIGGIFEELGEEYFKRGLDKAVGLVTGDERLSETEIIGGAEQIVDEFLRVSLNTVLMGGAREGMQQLGVRPSERRREKLYRQIESDIQEMDTNPEAAARVEQLLRNSRMPNPEAMSDVVFGELNAKPVDIDSLDDESRKRLTEFSQNHGVQVVPIQGAVADEGAFSPNTPGVIYVSVDALNDAGEWEAQTPAMVQAVATHEFVHDAQLLLGDRWVEVVERIKAKSPQAWDEAKRTYAEALGREEFAELTEGEQEQEAGAQIAQDNAVLLHALLNNDKIAGLIQQMGPMRGSDMTPGEVFLETVGRTLRLDFSGRKSAARAKKKLANILKQQGLTEQQARASYDIFTLMRDAVAARAAVRQNESKARFEGMEGQVSEEDLTLSPAEFERLLASEGASTTTVDPTAKPQGPTGIPAQEAALISPSLVPGVQELESQARGEGVTPQPAVEQEAMPAAEVSPTEGVIEDSTEFQMRNAAEAGRRLAVLRERLRAYSKREGMTARDRRTMQAIESEIAAIKARYPDTPVSVPEADIGLELEVGAEMRAARAEQQAQAEAEAAVQQQAQAEEAVRASTRMETDAPELPVTTGSRVRVEGQARRPKVAEEFEGPRRGAAILDDGQRVQRRTLVPLDTAMPVAVGATVRVRPGTPTQGRPVKTKSDQPLEVVRLTGPIGKQRAKLSDGRIVPVEGLRVVQQGPDATELAPEQLRQAQKAREDALRGRTRFSPRTKGLRRGGREHRSHGPRQEFVLSSVTTNKAKPENRLYDTFEEHRVVGMDGLRDDPAMKKHYDRQIQEARRILGPRGASLDDTAALREAEKFIVNNLLYLHDNYEEYRDRAKKWYDGANRIANKLADEHGIQEFQAAGTIAVLSPQRDWDQNVHLARLVTRGTRQAAGMQVTPDMLRWMQQWDISQAAPAKRAAERAETEEERNAAQALYEKKLANHQQMTQSLVDKGFDNLTETGEKGKFVRALIETDPSYTKNYRLQTPEGEDSTFALTDAGDRTSVGWPGNDTIGKAVLAMDATIEEMDTLVGDAHKVRSFYNNIMYPNGDWGDTTIDTHAVAAGMLMPYSGNSQPVKDVFGGGSGSSVTGIKGTYPLYASAYRRAAARVGILPREMQSITWEAARGLFKARQKTKKNEAATAAIWEDWRNGRITHAAARSRVAALYGGIDAPRWAASDDADAAGSRVQEGRPGRPADAPGRGVRRSPRAGVPSQPATAVPQDGGEAGRPDGADDRGVVPVIEGAERNENFQKFVRRTKVRDDKGKPLVVYHGTNSPNDFSKFDRTSDIGYHFGTQEQAQSSRFIGWAAKEGRSDADYYDWQQSRSARVYPVYLDIRNPLIMPDLGSWPAKAVVDVLQNLSGKDAKAYAADYARSSGAPMPDRLLKAFKPIPVAVVEDIIDALDTFDGNKWEEPQARVLRVAYNEIIRKHLQNAGYDGIAYINEAEGDKPAPSYITFSSHQVKSIHNQGTFDATNPDIRKSPRRRRPAQPMDRFDMPEMTGFEQFQANWVNRLQRAEQFEEYLSSNGMQVVGDESAVSMMKRYPGRLRSQHEDLTNNFQRPIVQIMGDAGLTVETVEDYLIARHTQEANRSLAERRGLAQQYREQAREIREFYNDEPDADIRSDKMREASNLEARAKKIDTREGAISYLTDQEAEDALKRMRESGDWESLEEIGALIDQMNAETRRKLLAGGLISQDQFDTWEKVFEHYVPFRDNDSMRGWSESSGYQDAKPVTHYRQGRVSRPSPLIFSFQQARSAINRSEKNKIGQRFVELLEKGNQVASMQRADESAPEPNWGSDQNAQSFSFKKNGDQMVVRIRDKDLARVFKNMDAAELGDFMQKVNSATRLMSNLNTQWNPAFLIPNAVRDGLTAAVIAGELKDKGWDVSRAAMAADTAKAIYAQLRPGRDAEMDDFIARYREAGGQIGWSDATDFETIASNIQKDLDKMADPALVKGARRVLHASTVGWIEPLNLAVEQATRIAVFKASVEAGMSEADAAVTAREITVDFNRRGFKSHYINSAYMFFNAGIQGTLRSAKALTSSPTVQATAFGGILLGFFQDLWMAGSSDEDEDGRLEWDNTGAWEKYMNLHFPGGYKLPLPYLWNMFPAIGQALGQIYRGVTTV